MSAKFENEPEDFTNNNNHSIHQQPQEEKSVTAVSGRSHVGFILFEEDKKEPEQITNSTRNNVVTLGRNPEAQNKDAPVQGVNSNRSASNKRDGQSIDAENSSRNAEFGSAREEGQQMFSERNNNQQFDNNDGQAENQQGHTENLVETRIIERNLESHINSLTEIEIKVGKSVAGNSLNINMKAIILLLVFYLYFEIRLRKDIIFLTFAFVNVIGFMSELYINRKAILVETLIFKFIESASFFIIILGIYIHTKFDISKLIYSINIYPFISICYWYKLHSPENKKHFPLYLIFRIYVYIQALHIALKVDNIIDWNWASIFWITWILLTTLLFYVVGLLVLALLTLYYTIVGDAEKFQRIFWCFSNISSYVIGAINLLFATLSHLTHIDRATMKTSLMVLIIWLSFNWLYSAIFSKDIINFVSLLLSDRDFSGFGTASQLLRRQKKKTRITIESSDKIPDDIPHFMLKFSSTYFQNTNVTADIINKLKTKKKEATKKKNAFSKKIEQLKDFKDKFMVKRKVKPITNIIKGENDHLNYSLCLEKYSKDTDPVAGSEVAPNKNQSFAIEKLRIEQNPIDKLKNPDPLKGGNILNDLSMDQGDRATPVNHVNTSLNNSLNQSVAQCLICYDQTPDSVLLECGHSGLCYECAVDIWKKTGECYLCRKPISKIVQLDIKAGVGKYMPVVKVSRMLKESFLADDSKIEEPDDVLGGINGEQGEDDNQENYEQNNQSIL